MALNTALKTAFFESGMTQVDVAEKTGIWESRLSKIVRGRVEPTDVEKKRIARTLKRPIDQLFPEVAA